MSRVKKAENPKSTCTPVIDIKATAARLERTMAGILFDRQHAYQQHKNSNHQRAKDVRQNAHGLMPVRRPERDLQQRQSGDEQRHRSEAQTIFHQLRASIPGRRREHRNRHRAGEEKLRQVSMRKAGRGWQPSEDGPLAQHNFQDESSH